MNTNHKISFLTAMALSAVMLSAQSKPNLSGTWELNVTKSDMGDSPVTKLQVQVEHKDPVLKYTATGNAGGEEFTEAETINTDGTPTTDSRGAQVKGHWENKTLVIESTRTDGMPLDLTHLTLSSDGKSMVRDYEPKGANSPQKRHEIYEKR